MLYPKQPVFKYPEVESQLAKWNGLLEWLVQPPKTTTYRVNLLRSDLKSARSHFSEIIDRMLPKLSGEICTIKDIPEVLCISSLGATCKEPAPTNSEIIVDTSCAAAVLRGAHIFAPGVLAIRSGSKLGDVVNVFADLEGKCKKGTSCTYESPLKVFLGTGVVKMQRYQLYGEDINPSGIAIEMKSTVSGVPSLGDLSSDQALLQNFPSIVCCRVLDPQPGETVLDMCASPGNKTTHIAELMQDKGVLVALDKTESKISCVRQKIQQLQLRSVQPFAFDSTKALQQNDSGGTTPANGPPFPPETFDRILLDAPCSALGNRPLLTCKLNGKMLNSYVPVQKKLFANAAGLLKKGGVLVYSTCTVTEAENEEIVSWAKRKFPFLHLVESIPIFGGSGLADVGLSDEERKQVQRFGPEQTNVDSVGFFIAKFLKNSTDNV